MTLLTTRQAIEVIARELNEELVICTTGYTCRDMQAVRDRAANFYMIGSMGVASSIGLGIALSNPLRRVVVFDGDGSVLMGLGALTMVGTLRPNNLIHVVFDNEAFVSTGNQPTYSSKVSLDSLALASGYPTVCRGQTREEFVSIWREMTQERKGPVFFLVKCRPDVGQPMERIRLEPDEIKSRFMEAVQE